MAKHVLTKEEIVIGKLEDLIANTEKALTSKAKNLNTEWLLETREKALKELQAARALLARHKNR